MFTLLNWHGIWWPSNAIQHTKHHKTTSPNLCFLHWHAGFENDDLSEDFDFSKLSSVDNSCTGSSICQICLEIDKYITYDVDTSNTTPGLTNELEFKNETITTILKANPIDLHVIEISKLVSSVQPLVKELEPLLIPVLINSKSDFNVIYVVVYLFVTNTLR